METRVCKECGRELPLMAFRATRGGTRTSTCNACIIRKSAITRHGRPKIGGGVLYSDPDFDGKTIGDVVRMMGRAKQWLESRGCRITLHGDFIETKTRKLKFE